MSAGTSTRSQGPRSRPLASQRRTAVAAALACLGIAGYLALHQRDQSRIRAASELGAQGRYGEAIGKARKVTRAPGAARALIIRAQAAQALGRHRDAVSLFRRAAEQNPRSFSLHRDWAISLLALGDRRAANRQLDLASTLNPRMETPPGF